MSEENIPDNIFEDQEDELLEDEYEKIKKLSEKYRKNREYFSYLHALHSLNSVPKKTDIVLPASIYADHD